MLKQAAHIEKSSSAKGTSYSGSRKKQGARHEERFSDERLSMLEDLANGTSHSTLQRVSNPDDEEKPIQKKVNRTGLPDNLKAGIEHLSGHSMDDVKVHYNSSKPATLQAHAYAQGTDIHIAPGQEKHLPHEAWHVVQQKQGRVRPTLQLKGNVNINDDKRLEKEADVMGRESMKLNLFHSKNYSQINGDQNRLLTLVKRPMPIIVTQRTVNGSFKELSESLSSIQGCPKDKSWKHFLNQLWPLLKKSPISYEIEDITSKFKAMDFDQKKIQHWIDFSVLKEHRDFLDHDILSGENPHGGKKHLGLSKKEQRRRLRNDDKSLGTSMVLNAELMSFFSSIKENLEDDLTKRIEPVALSGLDGLREGEAQEKIKQRLRNFNGEFSNAHYKISIEFGTNTWNQQALSFNLKVSPTLSSIEAFQVKQFVRTKTKHWKTKIEKESIFESETFEKQLNMYWGRHGILVPIDIENSEEQVIQAVKNAIHAGVTLF